MAKKKPIVYTPEQLHKRRLNLRSQLIFGNFLDTNIIVRIPVRTKLKMKVNKYIKVNLLLFLRWVLFFPHMQLQRF